MIHKGGRTLLSESQKEMRGAFLGGFAGQLISGLIWLLASGISVLAKPQYGMAVLFFGSMSIFPLTQLILFMIGRKPKVNKDNGLWPLGAQIAFIVPINFLLVGGISIYRPMWFFPAAMIVVGSHYLPFMTLYGMKIFGVLATLLISLGTYLALYGPQIFSLGGWITGILLIIFAFIGKYSVLQEEK
ncbi:DUF7010 family protein [Lacticigenium naphthae]|uniref:DUF7010 family protein n=1 Tax=Lacticigenium naphthae TaxID=515351 RepID=UPI000420607E|nr:hypothetical protein [Lacticigenium naphthae]